MDHLQYKVGERERDYQKRKKTERERERERENVCNIYTYIHFRQLYIVSALNVTNRTWSTCNIKL